MCGASMFEQFSKGSRKGFENYTAISLCAHAGVICFVLGAAAILLGYFATVYGAVMGREEQELREHHGAAFDAYARAVPLFLPRLTAAKLLAASSSTFSFAQYKKNQEYRAAIGFLLVLMVLVVIWRLRLA